MTEKKKINGFEVSDDGWVIPDEKLTLNELLTLICLLGDAAQNTVFGMNDRQRMIAMADLARLYAGWHGFDAEQAMMKIEDKMEQSMKKHHGYFQMNEIGLSHAQLQDVGSSINIALMLSKLGSDKDDDRKN